MSAAAFALIVALQSAAPIRHDIVFVLGEDQAGAEPFHAPALAWHRERRSDTRHLVENLRSLQAVREWLAQAHRGDAPWGEITLVAHGSPWTGLSVPIFDDAIETATPAQLARVAARHEFPALPDTVIDSGTRIVLDSCGLGRRQDLMDLMATLFGGDDAQTPRIQASTELVEYGTDASGSWRRERPMLVRAFAPEVPAQRMRAALSASSSEALPGWTLELKPIRVELTLPGASAVPPKALERLARRSQAAQNVLREHAVDAAVVRWRLLRPGEDVVLGEATLAQLSPPSAPP